MSTQQSRRTFVKSTATLGLTVSLAHTPLIRAASANSKINFAAAACGGKGAVDLAGTAESKHIHVAALCDIDVGRLNAAASKYPQARKHTNWMEMIDQGGIDAMTVSTPDHSHAPISVTAMRKGIHIYCQKPLSHTVHEARVMTKLAAKKNLVTQMGIQLHSSIRLKLGVRIFQDNAIGKVREVHAWTDRPIWPQGIGRPKHSDPVPDAVKWDQWLGVAPVRPYAKDVYHPFKWRGWEDFGTGALGDMGCHIIDPVMEMLDLGAPLSIRSDGTPPNGETFPSKSVIHYVFPGTKHTTDKKLKMTWYDGRILPKRKLFGLPTGKKTPKNGALLLGERGNLYVNFNEGPYVLPQENFKGYKFPKVKPNSHYRQWTDAIRGVGKTTTGFDYSGPLTEMVLLGNIALRYPGKTLNWDHSAFKFTNEKDPNKWLRKTYRDGYKVKGLG